METMPGTSSRLAAFALALTTLGGSGGCDEGAGAPIGPEGGLVISEDGRLSVEIPAGALDHTVFVSIHPVDDGPVGEPSVICAYAIEPLGTPLVRPAHVEFDWTVDADALALPLADIDDPALVIERGPQWRQLADRTVDIDAGFVSASAHYMGVVAVVD